MNYQESKMIELFLNIFHFSDEITQFRLFLSFLSYEISYFL